MLEYPHNVFGRVAGILTMMVAIGTYSQQLLLKTAQNPGGDSRWPFIGQLLAFMCFTAAVQMYVNYGSYINKLAKKQSYDPENKSLTKNTK